MKKKPRLPLISLFVLGAIVSPLSHAMERDSGSDEIFPSKSAAITEARSNKARSTAAASARSVGAVFEDDDAINSPATDGGDQTDATPIDESTTGLAQKMQEANAATVSWNQEQERLADLSNISNEEASALEQNLNCTAAYWRREQNRYEELAEVFNKNKQSQKKRAIRPVIDACEEAAEAAEQAAERLSELPRTGQLQRTLTEEKQLPPATLLTPALGDTKDMGEFLEKEICDNIYLKCLAQVAEMSLTKIPIVGNSLEEKINREWIAAQEMAASEMEKSKRIFSKAQKEAQEAQQKLDAANVRLHGKAYHDAANDDFKIKKLVEAVAEARVETASATLNAIKFKDTAMKAKVEAELAVAQASEKEACEHLKVAIEDLTKREVTPSITKATSCEDGLLDMPLPKIPALPQTPEEKKTVVFGKEIKEIAIAQANLEAAEAAHRAAKIVKAQAEKTDLDHEGAVYAVAEKAWIETVVGFQEAIKKAKRASVKIEEIEALLRTLKEAEASMALWSAHGLEVKARKCEQNSPAVGALEESQLVAIETAWHQASTAYQEAITKAKETALHEEAEEWVLHRDNAEVKKKPWTIQWAEKIEQSASECKKKADDTLDFEQRRWKNSAESFEEAAQYLRNSVGISWWRPSTTESKSLWREAFERAKASAEQSRAAAKTYASGNQNEGYRLNSMARSLLAQARNSTYLAKIVEADLSADKADSSESEESWREAAELNKLSIEFFLQSASAYATGKLNNGASFGNIGLAYLLAAERHGHMRLEAAELNKRSIEPFTQAVRAYATGKKEEGDSWNNAGSAYYWAAEQHDKASEMYNQAWSQVASQYECAAEAFIQGATAYAAGQMSEGVRWNTIGIAYRRAAEQLSKAIEIQLKAKNEEPIHEECSAQVVACSFQTEEEMFEIKPSKPSKPSYKIAEFHKQSSNLYLRAAEAYTSGKIKEGERFSKDANSLEDQIKKMKEKEKRWGLCTVS